MAWLVPVIARMVAAHVAFPIVLKKLVGLPGKNVRLFWQFFLAFLLSALLWFLSGAQVNIAMIVIGLIAIGNPLGAYAHWRAVDISLARTSVFTQLDDLIALGLGFLFLGEAQFLNLGSATGIVLLLIGGFLLSLQQSGGKLPHLNLILVRWVLQYSIVFGVTVFLMRFFALSGLEPIQFVLPWYAGSTLGALLINKIDKGESNEKLTIGQIGQVGLLSVAILSSFWLNLVALQLAPIAVTQPLFQFSEMILPFGVAVVVFREHKSFGQLGWLASLIGIIGGILIVTSFSR